MSKFRKTFVAELVELGDMDSTGAPTATFQWKDADDPDKSHLAKIEMPPGDLREIATAFYSKVRITLTYPPGEE
jgi:hypothetical protein